MVKYEYLLKRSARRSVSVNIKDDNSVIVHAPLHMPVNEIEKFLLSKSKWLDRHLQRNLVENSALSDIVSYKSILFEGVPVKLTLGGSNLISEDGVCVNTFKDLKKLYVANLGGQFLQLFNGLCRENNFTCGRVGFKDYKAKWGCCDRARNITFNYKLLMLPQNLWRYVAVHELCHTVYMNHSKRFYGLVGRILPTYKTDVKLLKSYSRITRLY